MTMVASETAETTWPLRWRNPAGWIMSADICAILIALSLPWSTSLVAVFAAGFLLSIVPFFDAKSFLRWLRRPVCLWPLALFGLAVVGSFWSSAPWAERIYAIGPSVKLLMLPPLFYHFERSTRGMQVLIAFVVSCILLLAMSWVVWFDPDMALKSGAEPGVPVKNYIDQSQEFTLCAVALGYPIVVAFRKKRIWAALLLLSVAGAFVATMLFVNLSRTAMVTMPIMLAVFGFLHLKWRTSIAILVGTMLLAVLAWTISPQLQWKVTTFKRDYDIYRERNQPTSIGLRLVFFQKSLRFVAGAPLLGHGTGSIQGLFEAAATGPAVLAEGQVVSNPHNQMLNVAIQWGVVGITVLCGIWLSHFMLFRGGGPAAWIGLLVVVQNVFTSLFNSHIFDFHEGWMYVLGVGIAGGMLKRSQGRSEARTAAGVDRLVSQLPRQPAAVNPLTLSANSDLSASGR